MFRNVNTDVKVHETTKKFKIERSMCQGDTISPTLLINLSEYMFTKIDLEDMCVNVDGKILNYLCFSDVIVLIGIRMTFISNIISYDHIKCNLILKFSF